MHTALVAVWRRSRVGRSNEVVGTGEPVWRATGGGPRIEREQRGEIESEEREDGVASCGDERLPIGALEWRWTMR